MATAKKRAAKPSAAAVEVENSPAPVKPPYRGQLSLGDYSVNVAFLRERFGLPPSKQFDKALQAAVADFQRGKGWTPSGRVDKGLWNAL